MKKGIICSLFFIVCFYGFAQDIPKETPEDIRVKLIQVQEEVKLKLDSCRINRSMGEWADNYLSNYFSSEKEKKIDSLNLRLSWGMLFDESMRERMLQLLNNNYRPEEMQQLLNNWITITESKHSHFFENKVIYEYFKIDTMKVYGQVRDSLEKYHRKEDNRLYQTNEIFYILQMDTLSCFKLLVDSLRKADNINQEKWYLENIVFDDMESLIRSCGNVGDIRFVEPIIKALNNLKIHNGKETNKYEIMKNERRIKEMVDALVKMKIEPYRTDYLKKCSRPLEEIKRQTPKDMAGWIGVLAYFGSYNQDYLLELSKYLWSSGATAYNTVSGPDGCAYKDTFRRLVRLIENEDFKELIGDPKTFDIDNRRFEIYDWMQANYGNYKIKYVW